MNKLKPRPISEKDKLKQVIEFQRELLAKETTIEGKIGIGHITNKTDPGSGRVLVKDIDVFSYSIKIQPIKGMQQPSIKKNRSKLHHAWIDYSLVYEHKEESNEVRFAGSITPYKRLDGSTSYGFNKLHSLAKLSLDIAHTSYHIRLFKLEEAYHAIKELVEELTDAIDENRKMCLSYLNHYLLLLLIVKYEALKYKLEVKNGNNPSKPWKPQPKRKKRKGFHQL